MSSRLYSRTSQCVYDCEIRRIATSRALCIHPAKETRRKKKERKTGRKEGEKTNQQTNEETEAI